MIVLDTHALLWCALDPQQLSATAADTCARMERDGGFASAISIWELAIEVKRGKLELPLSVDELAQRIEKSAVVEVLPVDTQDVAAQRIARVGPPRSRGPRHRGDVAGEGASAVDQGRDAARLPRRDLHLVIVDSAATPVATFWVGVTGAAKR